MRYIKYLFYPFWRIRYLVKISLKSGNTIQGWFYKIDWTYKGDTITNITWVVVSPYGENPLGYIDLSQIEAIQIVKARGFIPYSK